jgi:hypothetical protein
MDDEVGCREFDLQEFCPPKNILYLLFPDALLEQGWGGRDQCAIPEQIDREDLFTQQCRAQVADDGLDFGEFRHMDQSIFGNPWSVFKPGRTDGGDHYRVGVPTR